MKRFISFVLVIITLFSLCACAGGKGESSQDLIIGRWGMINHTRNEEAGGNANYDMWFFEDGACTLYCEGVPVKTLYWTYKESDFFKGNEVYDLRLFKDDVMPVAGMSLVYNKRTDELTFDVKVDNWEKHQFVFEKNEKEFEQPTADEFNGKMFWLQSGEWKASALLKKKGEYDFVKEQADDYVIKNHDKARLYRGDEFVTELDDFYVIIVEGKEKNRLTDGNIKIEASDKEYDMVYDMYTDRIIIGIRDEAAGTVEYMTFEHKETEMTDAEFAKMMLMNLYGDGVEFTYIYKSEGGKTVSADKIAITSKLIINDDNTYKFTLDGAEYYEGNCNYSEVRETNTGQGKFIKYGSGQHLLRIFTKENYIQLFLEDDDSYLILYFAKV